LSSRSAGKVSHCARNVGARAGHLSKIVLEIGLCDFTPTAERITNPLQVTNLPHTLKQTLQLGQVREISIEATKSLPLSGCFIGVLDFDDQAHLQRGERSLKLFDS